MTTTTSIRFVACAFLLTQAGGAMASAVPALDDYAYGFPVATPGGADYYHLELPYEVYRSVSDRRLRDLGVYDADGEPVPRVIERPGRRPEPVEIRVELRAFPLMEDASAAPDDIKLLLRQGTAGTELNFSTTGPDDAGPEAARRPVHYILDLRKVGSTLEALELDWAAVEQTFIGRVEIDGSDDLESWTRVGQGAIASLRQDDAEIESRRLTLKRNRHDYLRVSWSGLPEDWSLRGATGVFSERKREYELQWAELEPTSAAEGTFIFDFADGPYVEQAQLAFPPDNVVFRGSVYFWSEKVDQWVRLHKGMFFHWQRDGDAVVSSPKLLNPVRAERWKVVIDKGRKDTPIRLQLGWRPDRLMFVAQGDAPYVLAAGRGADAHSGFPQEMTFGDPGILRTLRAEGEGAVASLGPRFVMAGSDQLESRRPISWSTVSLWLALVLGVGLVGWMALRLVRQLGKTES